MPRDFDIPANGPLVCVLGMRGMPNVMGGVESHCQELLPRIASRALHLRLTAIGRKPYIGTRETSYRGVKIVPVASSRKQCVETFVSSFLGVLYARSQGAEAVHIHAVGSGVFAPLARLLGMKVIFTVHGADYQRAKWGRLARAFLRIGECVGVRHSDAVICVAPSLTAKLQNKYPEDAKRIRFVPNGAPPLIASGDQQDVLDRFKVKAGKFVLAVGRLEPGKGFELLIEAFRRSGRGGKLVIVGGAHHESAYAEELMKKAGKDVIFAGALPRETLSHLYRAASLFVLPSEHEGLPICALEAGLSGCPTLLSDIPGNRDLGLPDTHYFPSRDVDGLAVALGMPSRRFAVSPAMFTRFDWDAISAETLSIYNAVIGVTVPKRVHAFA